MELTALPKTIDKAEQGVWMDVYHPVDNTLLGIRILVAGADSDRYKTAQRKITNRRIQAASRGVRRSARVNLTAEELDYEQVELLVACVLGWDGIMDNGTELPCTPENVRMLFDRCPYIREQVDEFVVDRTNFLSDSSKKPVMPSEQKSNLNTPERMDQP